MNLVCIVFELGDKMLTLSSMENLIMQCSHKDENVINKFPNGDEKIIAHHTKMCVSVFLSFLNETEKTDFQFL